TIELVLEAARWAPSWANTQCWRFIVVRDSNIKLELASTLGDNPATDAIGNAPVVIVACAELGKSGYYQGKPATDKGDWYMFDVALAMQNLVLTAHSLGLGTVHVGRFETEKAAGILSHTTRSDTFESAFLLWVGKSNNPNHEGNELFIKMHGHEIYKYSVRTVPKTVKQSLDTAGLSLTDVKMVLIHQANEKMDIAILERLFKLYDIKKIPEHIMPMTISWLGNSSVATLPTLLDLVQRGKLKNHKLRSGDIAVFASVGAGMNINSMVYRML
ncbi:hypothetical protein LCGC14_2462280, partial [marine sediment metagenome]